MHNYNIEIKLIGTINTISTINTIKNSTVLKHEI